MKMISELPFKYHNVIPDIRIYINSIEKVKEEYHVVPVDLFTLSKVIEIVSDSIVESIIELNPKLKSKNISKENLSKALLKEVYVSRINEGCWEIFLFLGPIFGLIGTWIFKPSFEEIGKRIRDNITVPLLDKATIFPKIRDKIEAKAKKEDLTVNSEIKVTEEGEILDLELFGERHKMEEKNRGIKLVEKYEKQL